MVVVISGPIASGKSSLGRAVAARPQEVLDVENAVIDLDLVYEVSLADTAQAVIDWLTPTHERLTGQQAGMPLGQADHHGDTGRILGCEHA